MSVPQFLGAGRLSKECRRAKQRTLRYKSFGATIAPMSTKQRFLVNLIFDPEYKGYVADVPQLPGCMSQGKSVEAALKNIRKAIAVYLKATGRREAAETAEVLTSQVEVRV